MTILNSCHPPPPPPFTCLLDNRNLFHFTTTRISKSNPAAIPMHRIARAKKPAFCVDFLNFICREKNVVTNAAASTE